MPSHDISKIGLACTGCAVCSDSCPVGAISMKRIVDGFPYPEIDGDSCISCGKCYKVCPAAHEVDSNSIEIMYAAFSNDDKVREESSSGGVFATCAKYVVEHGGLAVGAAIDARGRVSHCIVDNIVDLHKLQKSKYVQSDTEGIYQQVRTALLSGRRVLFSGCPCQVAGLLSFLGREYPNLITMDLICHGVPSPRIWEEHVHSITNGVPADSISFRRKDSLARTTYAVDVSAPGVHYKGRDEFDDPYMALFVTGSANRESCYSCSYASKDRVSDITIGDCASSNCYPGFYPWVQLSSIAPITVKGHNFWLEVASLFTSIQIDHEREIRLNAQLSRPSSRPALRDDVYRTIAESGLTSAAEPVTPKRSVKTRLKRVIKIVVPNKVRGRLIRLKAKLHGR